MVNAQPIVEKYKCGKCGKTHNSDNDAENCCKKERIDWDSVVDFELKQVHLDLLKKAWVMWFNCEFGAPCIDPKRPYGNSSVEDDIANIIKLNKKDNFNFDEETWTEDATDYMEDLHKQTQIALQIILQCQTFRLGKYHKKDYSWHKN